MLTSIGMPFMIAIFIWGLEQLVCPVLMSGLGIVPDNTRHIREEQKTMLKDANTYLLNEV